ncbi:MAG: beta-N-acetylhexosaminidase [Desulfobacterales bacterium]
MNPQLTTSQSAGQRIIAGFTGTELNPDLKYLIDTLLVGGIILFSRNIENRDQLRRLCSDAQDYARTCGQPGLIIAVDQEGGSVARLKAPDFFQPPDAAQIKDPVQAGCFAEITASELNSVGINMNMAPVMDVASPDGCGIMANRSFAGDPQKAAESGAAVIESLQKNKVMAVAKHFPGIGRTTADSHLDLPEIDISLQQLETFDLVPFYTAVRHKAAGIMLSHVRYAALDPVWPASLSKTAAKDLLRNKIGYTGLTITDDLEMGAIANYYDMHAVADRVLCAEIDIALICHSMDKAESAFKTFHSALTDPAEYERSMASILRITEAKNRYLFY